MTQDLAACAADLSRWRPGAERPALPPAFHAWGSGRAHAEGTRRRLAPFLAARRAGELPEPLRALCAVLDPAAAVERLLAEVLARLGEDAAGAEPARDELRLNTCDVAPHNVLVRPDGQSVCLDDFESAGWDHPLALCTGFLTHARSLALPDEQRAAFLRAYRAAADVPARAWDRFGAMCALWHVRWCAIHLMAVDPALLARKRFADPAFDAGDYVADQVAQFGARLELAEGAVGAA